MKAFSIFEIRQIINGELIEGSDELIVDYIPHYKKIRKNKRNVLIFIRNKADLDLNYIKTRLPCAIVIDFDTNGLKSVQELTIIKVVNVNTAFWKFVQYYRGLFTIPVVAVTGTCGKTTTKEMITHLLSAEKKVQSTFRSANSRLAHLHYLLGIDEHTEAAVIETAVGKPGDIRYASKFFKPTIGIITNIGACHLNSCKTIEAYVAAKAEMVSVIGDSGVLILNADDDKTNTITLDHFKGEKILYFGIKNHADFQAADIQYGKGGMNFILKQKNISIPVFIPGYGEHQVANALAALAAVNEVGMDLRQAANHLRTFKNLGRHLEIATGYNGATIIDDTWNFNTTSLEAGMQVLNYVAGGKHRIALFTDMAALGDYSLQLHKEAGEIVSKHGVDTIITIGNRAKNMANYTRELGLRCHIYSFFDYDEVYTLLENILDENAAILIKSFGNNSNMIKLAADFKSS
ncbi:Mur ligase family protein [Neobacillus niacini]|jgi:UDP-N-acetylmuramoyl-tripeptide--D-alanyl-D-alanine ligase|uniref:Mur ligase family protein n=1 Tax=Neobacillus niacini TaxID=86668 RepID=UPI001C8F0E76|nr:Mur ligase family protein [Neobacillus niacini]MBY0144852.1 UDP-N-acetylmuramoyl-tripeptide--D-alanyl-D-alanine ligase [Neobacillus niacini]